MKVVRPARPRLEPILPDVGTSFFARQFVLSHFPFHWHYHPEIELTLIVRGDGLRFVGDSIEMYAPGDVVLIGSNVPHTWHSEPRPSSAESIVIQFPRDAFGNALDHAPEFAGVRTLLDRAARGLSVTGATGRSVAALMATTAATRAGSLGRWMGLLEALHAVADAPPAEVRMLTSSATVSETIDNATARKLQRIIQRLHDDLANDEPGEMLRQSDAAHAIGMTSAAFSRFFRRNVGRTYVRYVNEWRVNLACSRLVQTDQDVIDIAYACGFGNLSNFNRRFRQIKGTTPSAFRRLFHGKSS